MRALPLFLVILISGACGGSPAQPEALTATVQAVPDVVFRLGIGEAAVLPDGASQIIFVAVPEDSRCPAGAECVWQGNGRVRLHVRAGEAPATMLDLNTTLQPRETTVAGYTLRLEALDPYPTAGSSPAPDGYVAALLLTRG